MDIGYEGNEDLIHHCLPVKQVSETSQQSLLRPFILCFVLKDFISEWLAEVKRLEDRVGVACVAEIDLWSWRII